MEKVHTVKQLERYAKILNDLPAEVIEALKKIILDNDSVLLIAIDAYLLGLKDGR